MDPFPRDSDLRELFGADPALLDPDLPWDRNVLNFESVIGPDTVECVIEPAYQTLTVRWIRRDRELAYLDLERVAGIEVDRYRGRASLIVRFDAGLERGQVRIQLRPAVHITWVAGARVSGSAESAQRRLPL
ncbi:MAG TPA: hypothetical protein VF037_06410 [Gemmatimonadales bacterium]